MAALPTHDETAYPCMTALAKRTVIKFYCSTCDQKLSVPAGLEGQKFSCPNCAAPGHVPGSPPRELGVHGEAVIKFFCLHCGQKLSCESGAEGRAARCPVCGESTPVPESPRAGTGSTREGRPEPVEAPVNGTRKEEPEVILGPDHEKLGGHGGFFPGGPPAAKSRRDAEGPASGSPESTPDHESAGDPADLDGAALESRRSTYVMGSVSPEELFESLQDLGFEVEHVSVPPKDDDRTPKGD